LPEDPENTILKRLKKKRPEDDGPMPPAGQRSDHAGGERQAYVTRTPALSAHVLAARGKRPARAA
jgi:hypothetical protein